jgi:hypothetical protein
MTTGRRIAALVVCGALLLAMLLAPSAGAADSEGAGDGVAVYIWRDASGAVRFSPVPQR